MAWTKRKSSIEDNCVSRVRAKHRASKVYRAYMHECNDNHAILSAWMQAYSANNLADELLWFTSYLSVDSHGLEQAKAAMMIDLREECGERST